MREYKTEKKAVSRRAAQTQPEFYHPAQVAERTDAPGAFWSSQSDT